MESQILYQVGKFYEVTLLSVVTLSLEDGVRHGFLAHILIINQNVDHLNSSKKSSKVNKKNTYFAFALATEKKRKTENIIKS